MNKLKNKVFITLFLILTLSILSFITVFNVQNYLEQKSSIENNLRIAIDNSKKNNNLKPPSYEDNEMKPMDNVKFMDSIIYTILLDNNDNIKDIINHSNNSLNESDISLMAKKILDNNILENKNMQTHIGCLYFDNYSYSYLKNNALIILDTTTIKSKLFTSLGISLLIFSLLEIIVFFISKILSNKITKPVKESFDKQKQFIADASHELKTPLSVIIASSEALEDNPNEVKWLKNIKNEANRMNILITDLLELASTEKKETFKFEFLNLSKITELSVLTFEGIAFEHNIKILYNIDDNIKMNMDENSIKQLIEILLDNAIKHSYKKSTINVSLKEEKGVIELKIENNGEEIPKGEEEKIFERFYRVDKSRNRKENRYGLGLAIAKNIVLMHNGKINASSQNGTTTFKVLFKK